MPASAAKTDADDWIRRSLNLRAIALRPTHNYFFSSNTLTQTDAAFLFAICQQGTENCIKADLASPSSPLRLAFSRPGLLTFKLPCPEPEKLAEVVNNALAEVRRHWAVRLCGKAIGQISGESSGELIQAAQQLLAEKLPTSTSDDTSREWSALHVFQRDTHLPGYRGFQPGESELATAIAEQIKRSEIPTFPSPNRTAELGDEVLDIAMIDPNRWLIGQHTASEEFERYPGGVPNVPRPSEVVSRAYLKMAEALIWSQLPISPGDACVEIGSSPGGAAQRLLDLGLKVTGIDPAEMHPMVLQHARFEHWRSKSSGVKRRLFRNFKWLMCDANVAPNYTLEAVEDIVTYETSRFEGLLLTLKLSDYDLANSLPQHEARIRSWGFSNVRIRQLGNNRSECCAMALR